MRKKYCIERLQTHSSISPITSPTKNEREYLQIQNLSCVNTPLRIRTNAAEFIKDFEYLPVYVVVYQSDEFTECLYAFTYQPYNNTDLFRITRCIGKNIINKHKYRVHGFIDYHESEIRELSPGEFIEFY